MAELDSVLAALKALRGIDLTGYRYGTLQRRVRARMMKVRQPDPEEYARRLHIDPTECDRLIDSITIKVSSFFRDPIVFDVTGRDILPEIIDRKRRQGNREIRIWCAGCATGEEAWSLAILIHEPLKGELQDWSVLIFATDLDGGVLASAEAGVYPRDRLANVKLGILDSYFRADGDRFRIRPFLSRMVRFSQDDLVSSRRIAPAESVFGEFDMVFCRNVLIYYSTDVQDHICSRLCRSLGPGGYLVLGDAETLSTEIESKLHIIDRRNRIYRKPG